MNALVTGAASSVGAACAERLGSEGLDVVLVPIDCDRAECDRATLHALERFDGRLDVLVTISETRFEGPIEETSDAAFRELLEANLTAVFRVSRACFGAMRASGGGAMIHVTSDTGLRGEHQAAASSVTSAGVIALAELFAAEGAPYGIRSNAVCPKLGTDVAPTVAWLASDESRELSGAVLRVDAGAGAAMTVETRIA